MEAQVFDFDFDVKNTCDHLPRGLEMLCYMNPTQFWSSQSSMPHLSHWCGAYTPSEEYNGKILDTIILCYGQDVNKFIKRQYYPKLRCRIRHFASGTSHDCNNLIHRIVHYGLIPIVWTCLWCLFGVGWGIFGSLKKVPIINVLPSSTKVDANPLGRHISWTHILDILLNLSFGISITKRQIIFKFCIRTSYIATGCSMMV